MIWEKLPYLSVLAVLMAASIGVPIPEDIPLLTGGWLCHLGKANLYVMILVAFFGVLSGDIFLFTAGRRWGHHIVEHRFVRRLINPPRLLLAERLFEQHGLKIIFIARFLPGLRSMIFVASGVLRVPPWKFILVNGSAACISVPTLVILGKVFGSNFDTLTSDVRMASTVLGLLVLVIAFILVGLFIYRRQRELLATVEPIDADTLAHLPPGGHLEHESTQAAAPRPVEPVAKANQDKVVVKY